MSEKLWREMELGFLNQLYIHKGAVGINDLRQILDDVYEMKVDLFNRILSRVIEKEYCITEKIRKLDNTEEDIAFITSAGLDRLAKKKKISIKKIIANNVTYDMKCEGCETFSEWLEKNREILILEADITRMLARALADMGIVIMFKDDETEMRKALQEAIDRTKGRADKIPGYDDTVAYAVVMAIYNKIMELVGTDKVVVEAEKAQKLIESIMPKRHAMAVDFI